MLPKCINDFSRRYEIDWSLYPSVVFESDDWGACELTPDMPSFEKYSAIMRKCGKNVSYSSTLESPADLERIFGILGQYHGADGLAAVFTAFTGLGNPDFAAIRANGFGEYIDIGLDVGVPAPWERGDITGKMRSGVNLGVWAPEFHSFLHHTSPKMLIKRLNSSGPEGERARELFDINCYYQGEHVPEYEGLNAKEQFDWVNKCMKRFRNIFGFAPNAAVTSDAYPETELIWAANGIKAICLKNCRINSGEVVVYPTKPWNMQNVYEKIGNYNPMLNAVYITRNVFFEIGQEYSAEKVLPVIDGCFKIYNEPAMVSTHRTKYVSLDKRLVEPHYKELAVLLSALQGKKVYFLTTGEVADLYRTGYSIRKFGRRAVFRKWAENSEPVFLNEKFQTVKTLPGMKESKIDANDLNNLPCGNYLIRCEDLPGTN